MNMTMSHLPLRLPIPFVALLLAAALAGCGGDDAPRSGDAGSGAGTPGASGLPTPDSAGGSITGMPESGPATPTDLGTPPEPAAPPESEAEIDPETVAEAESVPPPATDEAGDGPGADAAVQLVRDDYAAINQRQYDRAYQLWSGAGAASGQSPAQFALGFADTRGVSVQIGRPGRIDPGAGQRRIEVPVQLSATRQDGSEVRYIGSYVLHRTVVDGASAAQRNWRIESASLKELR